MPLRVPVASILCVVGGLSGCGLILDEDAPRTIDASEQRDSSRGDGSTTDGGQMDAGEVDGGQGDSGRVDGSGGDAGGVDAGGVDASGGDASRPDSGVCAAGLTHCGGACIDVSTDVDNCGGCSVGCSGDPAVVTGCAGGACTYDLCVVGLRNCNADPADGCEIALGTDADCSRCGDACASGTTCDGTSCVAVPFCAVGGSIEPDPAAGSCSYTCGVAVTVCDDSGACYCTFGTGPTARCASVTPGPSCGLFVEAREVGCCAM